MTLYNTHLASLQKNTIEIGERSIGSLDYLSVKIQWMDDANKIFG